MSSNDNQNGLQELRPFERNHYFYGKLFTSRDMIDEQSYFNEKRWWINRLLLGRGIVCGLDVKIVDAETLTITKGVALDPLGRELVVSADKEIALADLHIPPPQSGTTKTGFLSICYEECPREQIPALGGSTCEAVCDFNRIRETYQVRWSDTGGPPTEAWDEWLNLNTVVAENADVRVERTAPVWVRANQVFEVALKVTARKEIPFLQITESTNGSIIEPNPTPPTQFPTVSVSLRTGEYFFYVYQVKAAAIDTTVTLTLSGATTPACVSKIEVVSNAVADEREAQFKLKPGTEAPDYDCVDLAELKVTFNPDQTRSYEIIADFDPRRLRYDLIGVTNLLDALRTSLAAEPGSQRPGHAFITFKDFELPAPRPISSVASTGTHYTVPRGDHVHDLLRATNSGLEFIAEGEAVASHLRINGNVGGPNINFLNPVSGQTPVQALHLVTKQYVDGKIAGLDWKESVKDKDLVTPPTSPAVGDRYLVFNDPTSAAWEKNAIATWNGSAWELVKPNEGAATFVEDENITFLFVDGNWIPFLAVPSVTAGAGLTASGAVISVGQGPGIKVNADDVTLDFETISLQPIGVNASHGTATSVPRGDHVHAFPRAANSGIDFSGNQFKIDGNIGGTMINFLSPVSGQTPTLPLHLATKQYIDAKVAGLSWQQPVKDKDLVTPPTLPAAGDRYLLATAGLTGVWAGHQNQIATFTGTTWEFTSPIEGTATVIEDEDNAYLFANGSWTKFLATPSLTAGAGLQLNSNVLSVVFATNIPNPDSGAGSTGVLNTVARGDHTHPQSPLPGDVYPTTGTVSFDLSAAPKSTVVSKDINPGLGPGPLCVVLGLDTPEQPIVIGDLGISPGTPSILLAAEVTVVAEGPLPNLIRLRIAQSSFVIRATSATRGQNLPNFFRVRYWVMKPGKDLGEITANPLPDS